MSASPTKHSLINLPDVDRFMALAAQVFASGQLTNNGTMASELESRLARYLGVKYLVLTSSGTLALQVAYRALGLSGEVITTPFSWATTVSSLPWLGLRPTFADIDANTFNIDASRIDAQVTTRTSAILAVHSFGNPADIDHIERIAARHGLRTVYDAAHAFGVRYRDEGILSRGDASVLSLHATKLFHTVEGGAIVLRDEECYRRAKLIVNNGISPDGTVQALGINGRMSELHAAVGLCLLENIDDVLEHRRTLAENLRAQLTQSSAVTLQHLNPAAQVNHSFFPVVFPTRELREHAMALLCAAGFPSRRYFNLALSQLPFLDEHIQTPIAESLCERILCLPLHVDASMENIKRMTHIVATVCPLQNSGPIRASG